MSTTANDELTVEDLASLAAMVRDVLADIGEDHDRSDTSVAGAAVWRALTGVGVTRLGLREDLGGDGGGLLAATEVLRIIGEYAAPGPLAETSLLGGWLLEVAGLPQPSGPVSTSAARIGARREGDGWRVQGELPRVPTTADTTVVAVAHDPEGAEYLVVLPEDEHPSAGHNLARERRDTFHLDLTLDVLHPLPAATAAELRLRGGLSRALLTAGALRRVEQRTLTYAGERVQFGRPIAAFQAVQHQLAAMVAETAAAQAAVDQAVRVVLNDGFLTPHSRLLVAAAKVRSAQATSTVCAIAHQIHAALGMTDEHPLHFSTTRLWSWRSEWGAEADWADEIADRATAVGSAGLWTLMTGPQ